MTNPPPASAPAGRPKGARPAPTPPDIDEMGAARGGEPQRSSKRLFMQLHAFGECLDPQPVIDALDQRDMPGTVYLDVSDPRGIAILTWNEDPAYFVETVRPMLLDEPFLALEPRPEFTMFGRTYSIGYEPDLQEVLFDRPIRHATTEAWPWAVWYPLRRSGAFARLDPDDQKAALMEHGKIGHAFGSADYAHDIRLACYGMDTHDNDFVVALVGKELHPLSAVVQAMRGTIQTSQYIDKLGPFFVGKAVRQRA